MQHTEGTAMTKCRSKTKGVKVKVTEHLKTKRMEYIAGHSAQDKSVKMKGKTLYNIRPCHNLPYLRKNSYNIAHQSHRTRDWGNHKSFGTMMTVRFGEGIIENNMPPVKVEHHHVNYTGLA